jgi:predicted porin
MHTTKKTMWAACILSAAILTSAIQASPELLTPTNPQAAEPLEFNMLAQYDSRYMLEGRDILQGNSILNFGAQAAWKDFAIGINQLDSPDTDYEEFQAGAAWSTEIQKFELSLGYTYFNYQSDGGHEHEINITLSREIGWGIQAQVDAYYGFRIEGAFIETALSKPFSLSDKLVIEPMILLGFNADYVEDGHNGANHTAAALKASYQLTENFELETHLVYNLGINKHESLAGDDNLDNKLHFGAAILLQF